MSKISAGGLIAAAGLGICALAIVMWLSDPGSSHHGSAAVAEVGLEQPGETVAQSLIVPRSERTAHSPGRDLQAPKQPQNQESTTEESAAFDVETGPYSVEYFDSLSVEEVLRCRRALSKAMTKERGRILESIGETQTPISYEEYVSRGLEGAEDIYVPRYGLEGIKSLAMFYVSPVEFPRYYSLRERARIIQSSIPFREDLLKRQNSLLEKLERNPEISNLEVVTSSDGYFITVYGVMDGIRSPVGGMSADPSR